MKHEKTYWLQIQSQSEHILVLKFSVNQSYANKIIRAKNSIHCRKKVKFPKRTPQQKKLYLMHKMLPFF